MKYEFLYNGKEYSLSVEKQEGFYRVSHGDRIFKVEASPLSQGLLSLIMDGRSVLAHTARDEKGRIICIHGVPYHLLDPSTDDYSGGAGDSQTGGGLISTPMPGKIVTVHVKEGDSVEKGQALLVVESMKMQNDIVSDVKGVVKKIHLKSGDQASFGQPLVEIEEEHGRQK